jgi:hypothetical protein
MTEPDVRRLDVALAERSYPIHIGAGALRLAGSLLAGLEVRTAVVVTNDAVAGHWLPPLLQSLAGSGVRAETVLIPDGEAHKNWTTLHDVLTRLLELRAERGTVVVALGGGVVGDIAGFAAAIYQRGVPFLQIPTTLLAQVDSSVGGKTGINHPLGKNMIGAFHQPRAVLIDTDSLRTFPIASLQRGGRKAASTAHPAMPASPPGAKTGWRVSCGAIRRRWRMRSTPAVESKPKLSALTNASVASARCSISATRSGTRSKMASGTARGCTERPWRPAWSSPPKYRSGSAASMPPPRNVCARS